MAEYGEMFQYRALKQPGRIGTLELPHRVLMGSMHLGLEGHRDKLAQLTRFYQARAEGLAALIITGGVAVTPEGGGDNMYDLTQAKDVEALTEVSRAVHQVGGKIALQLFHSGRYVHSDEIGMQAVAPSAIPCRLTREIPRALTVEDIARTVEAFAQGALTAKNIGFDAVEIMGSEGYLLNQFFSPLTNQRDDDYGGNLMGRMRMSIDVVTSIRKRVGTEFPVIFRMSGQDCMQNSSTDDETIAWASSLEKAGVDALNIGIGWHESRVPTVQQVVPRAGFASIAAAIRCNVTIPVLGANRINVPELADALIANGYLDFIAPARPWLADSQLARKIIEGDRAGLNVCIACNQSCLDHTLVRPQIPVSCLVNPRAGQESVWPIREATAKRKIAVVGAGPAGLQAAVTAAECGHAVTLYERGPELGGQFRMAARIPGKDEFYETIRYYREMLNRHGVMVKMETKPSADELLTFDHVILAQGVVPHLPAITGADLPHVVTYAQILTGEVPVGQKIAVIGSGGIGCDVAMYLGDGSHLPAKVQSFFAEQQLPKPPSLERSITVLARSGRYGHGIGRSTRWVVRQEMDRLGVTVILNFSIREITANGIAGETEHGPRWVAADQVILCTGQESAEDLAPRLRGKVPVHIIGGARESQGINAARAIREGFETAYHIS